MEMIDSNINLIREEDKFRGLSMRKACCSYLKRGIGFKCNILLILLVALPALMLVFLRIFIMKWVSTPPQEQGLSSWLAQLAVYVLLVLILGGLSSVLVAQVFLSAGSSLHNAMLERVVRAPMSFFHSNPVGRILNRFSRDTAIADYALVR